MFTSRCSAARITGDEEFCAAMVNLCFNLDADMFECDDEGNPTENKFVPENLITTQPYVGLAFNPPNRGEETYFMTGTIVFRIDGMTSLDYDSPGTNRIAVFNAGEPPKFLIPPDTELEVEALQPDEVFFSELVDPEGEEVYMKASMKKATMFAHFDYREMKLVIGNKSRPGVYKIEIAYGEVLNGIMMPPQTFVFTLTVTKAFVGPPVLLTIRDGAPITTVSQVLFNG